DLSLDDAGGLVEDAAVMGERNVRDEARRARLELSRRELAVDGRELGRVIGAVPARRMHARGAAERLDLEPRIVGDRGQPGLFRVIAGLQARVLGEGLAGLLGLGKAREVGE